MQHPSASSEVQEDSEDKDEIDEDGEEEDSIDEDFGEDNGDRKTRPGSSCLIARTITLQMLLEDGLLQPADGAMSIEYMGQRFVGDLLHDGKIRSQETDIIFATPSAWAVNCKRIINPIKRSGCGWASVRYKGRKLDAYKNIWINRRTEGRKKSSEDYDIVDKEHTMLAPPPVAGAAPRPPLPVRAPVKHHTIGSRTSMHDPNMLVESTSFSTLGKIQPFLVSMATNAVLTMDFHCHLSSTEVCGYLAGQWDVNAHNLSVMHAFPCRSRLDDPTNGPQVERQIRLEIEKRGLIPVGWYHSHPTFHPAPSLRDLDKQLDHEMQMKGSSDSSYTPCIGVICSPYFVDNPTMESSIVGYWVAPPPENKPLEYGKAMTITYSVVQDAHITKELLQELEALAKFYKDMPEFIDFNQIYKNNVTYLEKLKLTLTSKFPRDQTDGILWGYIRQMVTPGTEEKDQDGNVKVYTPEIRTSLPPAAAAAAPSSTSMTTPTTSTLVVPVVQLGNRNSSSSTVTTSSSNATTPGGLGNAPSNPGFFLGADMASAMLAAGKLPNLPSGTSLMSVLPGNNQNNMFMSPVALSLLSASTNSNTPGTPKGSKASTLNSLAALSSLGNLGNLGNLSIASLANLSNLGIGNLANLAQLANSLNKNNTSNLGTGGMKANANLRVPGISVTNGTTVSTTIGRGTAVPLSASPVSITTNSNANSTPPDKPSSGENCEIVEENNTGESKLADPVPETPVKPSASETIDAKNTIKSKAEIKSVNNHTSKKDAKENKEEDLERPAKVPKYDSPSVETR